MKGLSMVAYMKAGLYIILAVMAMLINACREKAQDAPPNILFIAVDDLRPELGCYGNGFVKSPNIDALAAEGLVFDRAYCQQAICMASRASLLSGYSPELFDLYACGPVNATVPREPRLDDFFRNKGYTVRAFGKIYHHRNDHLLQFGGRWLDDRPDRQWKGRGYLDPDSQARIFDASGRGPAYESPAVADDAYLDGYLADRAAEALEGFAQQDAPFFLAIGFHKPHLPFNAPKKYWDMYDREEISLPGNDSLPLHHTEHSLYNFGELRNYAGIPKGQEPLPDSLKMVLKHGYYACVSYMDAQLGKVLDKLGDTGLDANTIVILWGDHGWKLGEHGMWCKHTNFELDTRVPLIIKAPGYATGTTESFAELLDLYPTLAELCGFEVPSHAQGISLAPNLRDPASNTREAAYSLYPHGRNDKDKLVMGYTVRTDGYRYIRWINISERTMEAEELYDHTADPGENVNVAEYDRYREEKAQLAALLNERWKMSKSMINL